MGDPESDGRRLTHLDDSGRARMVDVGDKPVTRRRAVAEGTIRMDPETLHAIRAQELRKGDALTVARLAAIGGAKRTPDLIPLCHPLPLDAVEVTIDEVEASRERGGLPGLRVRVAASTWSRTGVEMEAMCGVTAGLLAVYDMAKSRDRGMRIEDVRLLEKSGGRSGRWARDGEG